MNSGRQLMVLVLAAWGLTVAALRADDVVVIDIESPETAVLDPANWDTAFSGERYFDALRPMLVRFPGVADRVHHQIEQGYEIASAHLILEWERQEGARPERGRSGWGSEELYTNDPGQWSAVAWPLRQPWSTEFAELAPTFNAYVNGLGFWERGGARGDGVDRGPRAIGPMPLHQHSPTAELDVTAVLLDGQQGQAVGQRLRAVEQQGFAVYKHELYDLKYMGWSGYDWAVATGYMRIWVKPPILRVRLRRATGDVTPFTLPQPIDIREFADTLRREGGRGTPSVHMPDDIRERAGKHFRKPHGMPVWQWERLRELMNFGVPGSIGRVTIRPLRGDDEDAYLAAMRDLMMRPPRFWYGHLTTDLAIVPARYGDLLPPGVMDHLKLYWRAWLHPELESRNNLPNSYQDGEPSRQGVPSYFRGYSHGGGTMNFGHNAVTGVLLGAQLLDAAHPLREARQGVQRLLRGWGIGTGAHQEAGDTYYQALTLAAAAAIAHHAEDELDALSAWVHANRLNEIVISMYNPTLRRITHPQGRGQLSYQLLFQDGPYHILHNMSRDGVLMHLDDLDPEPHGAHAHQWGQVYGIPIFGSEGFPARIAMLKPWIEPWLADAVAEIVDRRPYPWRVHARSFNPGERAGWHVTYMTDNYTLASRDNAVHSSGVYSAVAQWRRNGRRVNHVDDLGSLFLSAGADGAYQGYMGYYNLLQHDNAIVAVKERLTAGRLPDEAMSLHASLLLLAHGDTSEREVWIDDRRIEGLGGPAEDLERNWADRFQTRGHQIEADSQDRIAVKDGNTYIGVIPVAVNAPRRDIEVMISYDYPALLMHSFLHHSDEGVDPDALYDQEHPPTAGFIIELGDAAQYGSFETFRRHMMDAQLTLQQDADDAAVTHLQYRSGDDLLEMGCRVKHAPSYRRINGQWPYIPEGVMRRSGWAIQNSTGVTELHGATIHHEPGRHAYLQVIPSAGATIAHNALPELAAWGMETREGLRVAAAGKIGLARVIALHPRKRLSVRHAWPRGLDLEEHDEIADALLLFGADADWHIEVNGRRIEQPRQVRVDGAAAYMVPLTGRAADLDLGEIVERYRTSRP